MVDFVADLLRGLDQLPTWFLTGLAVAAQIVGVGLFAIGLAAVIKSKAWHILLAAIVAAAVAGVLTALLRKVTANPGTQVADAETIAAIGGGGSWSAGAVAALVAVVTASAPWVPRSWRRIGWALTMAVAQRRPAAGVLHHSDRGSQYACGDYQALLTQHGMRCSMSRKGDCWDNAVVESFFATLKAELVDDADWATREKARTALFEYI